MCLQGQYIQIETELLKLPQGKEWLRPDVKITYTPLDNDSSDEDDDSGSDDMEIDDEDGDNEASCSRITRSQTRKKQDEFVEPEDGWTTVRNTRRK